MDSAVKERIEGWFPNLKSSAWDQTSGQSGLYNCIAWAMGEDWIWWEPTRPPQPGYYWPTVGTGKEPSDRIDDVIEVLRGLGFEDSRNDCLEPFYLKVALYAEDNTCLHAARLAPSGRWASKLGPFEDIEHDRVDGVEGPDYGTLACIMQRRMLALPPARPN